MELKIDKEKSYYSTVGMKGFREFLISEQQSPTAPGQSDIDKQIKTVRSNIQLTKKRLLLKYLSRELKIIDDKESNTSSDAGFIK